MKTHCKSKKMEFTPLKNKKVIAGFEGNQITSDAGLLLIKQLDEKFRITGKRRLNPSFHKEDVMALY